MESIARKLTGTGIYRGLLAVCCLSFSGCASQSLYYWGEYEDLIYQMYNETGSADPATQVAKLKEDIGKAGVEGKLVPPGLHAHLGYMYFLEGDTKSAIQEFETEKELFPESATFVDGLMNRIKK